MGRDLKDALAHYDEDDEQLEDVLDALNVKDAEDRKKRKVVLMKMREKVREERKRAGGCGCH